MITRSRTLTIIVLMTIIVSFSVPSRAQKRPEGISFDTTTWDFGQINESDGAVSHVFTIMNASSESILIRKAIPSCSCIVAHFPDTPLAPGEAGSIEVFFSPSGVAGLAHRSVELVDSRGRSIGNLYTNADVIPSDRSIQERYPIVLDANLYASRKDIPFGYIAPGESSTKVIWIANSSDKPMDIEIMGYGSDLVEVTCDPTIAPGDEIPVMMTYTMPSEEKYMTVGDTLAVITGGHEASARITTSALCLRRTQPSPKAARMRTYPSTARMSRGLIMFWKHSGTIEISNDGAGDLLIQEIEVPQGAEFSIAPGTVIPKGKTLKATLTVSGAPVGNMTVGIFTNDPERPYKELIYIK